MASKGNPLGEERRDIRYIRDVLWPEFLAQFIEDNKEYPEERPLGARAEWHGMHRKVGKLQAPIWEGKPWTGRESVRRMFLEIIGHAFLAVASLDYAGESCSTECNNGAGHTYGVGCKIDRMLRKPSIDTIPPALADMVRDRETSEPFTIGPGKLIPVDEWPETGPPVKAPADETEAYTEQRRARHERRAESPMLADQREAAAWRVRHCGPGCAYGHRYSGECQNVE